MSVLNDLVWQMSPHICTHRWQWGCSWCWRCRSRWWLCRCRFPSRPPPPPWSSGPCEGYGIGSSRCGCYAHPWSTWWAVGGLLPRGRAVSWRCRFGLTVCGRPCQTPGEVLWTCNHNMTENSCKTKFWEFWVKKKAFHGYAYCIYTIHNYSECGFLFLKDSRIQLCIFFVVWKGHSIGHSVFLVLLFLERPFEAQVAKTSKSTLWRSNHKFLHIKHFKGIKFIPNFKL